jgi:hypothetical protein
MLCLYVIFDLFKILLLELQLMNNVLLVCSSSYGVYSQESVKY